MNQVEIKPENIEQNQTQVNTAQAQTTTQETPEPSHSSEVQKENWRKFREQKELERKQRIEAEKIANEERARAAALQAALEAAVNKGHQQTYQENDESEEQRLEKKVNALLAQKEAAYEKQRLEREQAEFPQKLVQTFNDFNQVCTTENLDYLEYHYPELATPFKHMPDGFDKWASIYKAVKRFVPNPDSKKDMQKMEKNLAKPQSMSSPGTTQGGNAMPSEKLTEEKRAANWERMQRTLKGLS